MLEIDRSLDPRDEGAPSLRELTSWPQSLTQSSHIIEREMDYLLSKRNIPYFQPKLEDNYFGDTHSESQDSDSPYNEDSLMKGKRDIFKRGQKISEMNSKFAFMFDMDVERDFMLENADHSSISSGSNPPTDRPSKIDHSRGRFFKDIKRVDKVQSTSGDMRASHEEETLSLRNVMKADCEEEDQPSNRDADDAILEFVKRHLQSHSTPA